jgi:hypothetical protein
METIDDLLKSYKTLSDQVAKSNALNEKVFREMMMRKVRNSVNVLYGIDLVGNIFGVIGILYFAYAIFKCASHPTMFVLSILLFLCIVLMMFLWWNTVKWKMSNSLVVADNVGKSILKVRDYVQQLRKQRLYTIIASIPMFLLEVPVLHYLRTHKFYWDFVVRKLETNMTPLLIQWGGFIVLFFLIWKMYDWVNFRLLHKIERNLKELEE